MCWRYAAFAGHVRNGRRAAEQKQLEDRSHRHGQLYPRVEDLSPVLQRMEKQPRLVEKVFESIKTSELSLWSSLVNGSDAGPDACFL